MKNDKIFESAYQIKRAKHLWIRNHDEYIYRKIVKLSHVSFLVLNHIFENGVNGITKEAGGFANKVLPAGSRKWNSVSIFFKNPSRLVATTQVAYRADDKLVRPAR